MPSWNDNSANLPDREAALRTELSSVGGSRQLSPVQTTNYTVQTTDDVIRVDNSSTSVTITLPTAVGVTGKVYSVVKVNAYIDIWECKVQGTSGQTVAGQTNVRLLTSGDHVTVVSDGANWIAVEGVVRATAKQWYVDPNTPSSGDGRSPRTPFGTFAEAIAAAGGGDTIHILGDITESCVVNKSVRILGGPNRPSIKTAPGHNAATDYTVLVTASNVQIENLTIFIGNSTNALGCGLVLDGCAQSSFRHLIIQPITGTTATSYPTSPGAGTGAGGIGVLCNNGEGSEFEDIVISSCSIGFAVGQESSTNVVNRIVFTGCVQELVMGLQTSVGTGQPLTTPPWAYGGGNGGGWTFSGMKNTQPVLVSGVHTTDLIGDGTTNYIGSNNGANTFINADWTESNPSSYPRIGSAGNTFIRPVSAPASEWIVEGQRNRFINIRILGAGWLINSDNNEFDGGWSNGCITGPGNKLIFRNMSFTEGPNLAFSLTGSDNLFENCTYGETGGGAQPTLSKLGTRPKMIRVEGVVALTYGTTVTPDVYLGTYHTLSVTNGTAFTIANPIDSSQLTLNTNIMRTPQITFDILNSSGGAMGALTWGSDYKLAGAFTNPANGKRRTITFQVVDGTTLVEVSRAAADI